MQSHEGYLSSWQHRELLLSLQFFCHLNFSFEFKIVDLQEAFRTLEIQGFQNSSCALSRMSGVRDQPLVGMMSSNA